MLQIMNGYLDIPVDDPDVQRRARLLNVMLVGVAIVSILALILLIVTDLIEYSENSVVLYIGTLVTLFGILLIFWLNRRGNVDLASTLFLALLTVVFAFADTPENVVKGRSLFMFVIPVLMASFLLRPSASFAMAAAIVLIQLTIAFSASVPDYSPLGLVAYMVIALIAWLAASGLETALTELRVINRELDQRVVERTQELADANKQLEQQARELVDVNLQLEQQANELEKANQQLTELDRLKSKFVSDVSHELRTPISNLKIYLEMLQGARPERRERYREVLQEETDRLGKLVSDVLDISRMEMGTTKVEFGWLDLNKIVELVVTASRPRARAKGLHLFFVPGEDTPQIWADTDQMNRVVNNLIGNAVNYTAEGEIRVSTHFDAESERACLVVKDSGFGIAEEDIPHLFERFYRGKQAGQSTIPGTGLGLAITKEIVDGHGGEIKIESQIEVGSTFTVSLPIDDKSVNHGEPMEGVE